MVDPLTSAVGGFTIGMLIGYAARKVATWILTAIGIFLLILYGLWTLGVIIVNWDALGGLVAGIVSWIASWLSSIVSNSVTGATFSLAMVAGFVTGFSIKTSIAPAQKQRFVKRIS